MFIVNLMDTRSNGESFSLWHYMGNLFRKQCKNLNTKGSQLNGVYEYIRYLCNSANVLPANTVKLCCLIELAFNRRLKDFLNEATDKSITSLNSNVVYEDNSTNYNVLNRCVFVVKDLEFLLNTLKNRNKSLVVNAGPQSSKGSINSLTSSLALFDSDFWYALYTHKYYHSKLLEPEVSSLFKVKKLGISKFSFKNIHMNLGLSRYYSTHRPSTLNYG